MRINLSITGGTTAFTIAFLCTGFILSGCTGKKSYKQIFDETFEANVQACLDPLVKLGTDTSEARRICECMLNTMFELDSTYQSMDPDQARELFIIHEDEILKCVDEYLLAEDPPLPEGDIY